jgi:hypothetical protein
MGISVLLPLGRALVSQATASLSPCTWPCRHARRWSLLLCIPMPLSLPLGPPRCEEGAGGDHVTGNLIAGESWPINAASLL